MPTPCKQCKRLGRQCRIDLRSGRCVDCVQLKQKCDLVVTQAEFQQLRRIRKNLEEKLVAAESEEDELIARLNEQRAKVKRLRREARFAKDRLHDSLEKEMASIEEAEQLERELVASSGAPIPVDFVAPDPVVVTDILAMSTEDWSEMGGVSWDAFLSAGGTSEVPLDNL